jgi:GNAT superfamily N-acetyltransferase
MYYRRSGEPVVPPGQRKADVNHDAFQALVEAGVFTGLLAYEGAQAVGWLSFGPARTMPSWPAPGHETGGRAAGVVGHLLRGAPHAPRPRVARALLGAAMQEARQRGVTLEAYPVDKPGPLEDDNLWFGPASLYAEAGFTEVARRKPERPVVRLKPV